MANEAQRRWEATASFPGDLTRKDSGMTRGDKKFSTVRLER
jgi:hypothetical protein